MRGRILAIVVGALALAGCGGGSTETVTVTRTETVTRTDTTPLPGMTTVRVYFLREGKVAAAGREIPRTRAVAAAALRELYQGPTEDEQQFGLTSVLPNGTVPTVAIQDANATVGGAPEDRPARGQIVYTLTQFPTVQTVQVGGKQYTRDDFEDLTPAILVESPLPFQHVTAPLRVTGTANTFEANFEYELTDPDGLIVKKGFTTATSGSGMRGTFDFTIPFEIAEPGLGELIVFERSAADGSRTNLVEISIRFGP